MEVKLKDFKDAQESFSYLVNLDLENLKLDKRLIDAIEYGIIQKFEYAIELCWKLICKFLKQADGLDSSAPKQCIKGFYLAGYIDEDYYMQLIYMIDDRDKLSRICNDEEYKIIMQKFPIYSKIFEKVDEVITGRLPEKEETEEEE
jgi:nucleotidyltransferase substrate binding protein (TIGR01987 family)